MTEPMERLRRLREDYLAMPPHDQAEMDDGFDAELPEEALDALQRGVARLEAMGRDGENIVAEERSTDQGQLRMACDASCGSSGLLISADGRDI